MLYLQGEKVRSENLTNYSSPQICGFAKLICGPPIFENEVVVKYPIKRAARRWQFLEKKNKKQLMVIPDNLNLQMVKKVQILVFAKTLALVRIITSIKEHEKICLRRYCPCTPIQLTSYFPTFLCGSETLLKCHFSFCFGWRATGCLGQFQERGMEAFF